MKIRMLPVLSLALGFALACGGGADTTTPVTPPPPPAPVVAPVAAGGSIGVPECDDYIKKMEACIATADPAAKSAMETGFKSTRDAWAQAAAVPETKGTLASSCSAMLASIPTNCGVATTTTTEVTTTTTTTTTAPTDEEAAKAPLTKPSSSGQRAPARDPRPPASMERSRDGSSSGSGTSSGGTSGGSGGGMGRSK